MVKCGKESSCASDKVRLFYDLDLFNQKWFELKELVPFTQCIGIGVKSSGNLVCVDQGKLAFLQEHARQLLTVGFEFFIQGGHRNIFLLEYSLTARMNADQGEMPQWALIYPHVAETVLPKNFQNQPDRDVKEFFSCVMFWFRKREKRPPNLPKGQRSVYEGLHNLLIRFSGEQWAILTQFSNQWSPNKSRELKNSFRKDAKLRELFLECVAVQCVLLFRTAVGSRYSDHADYITNGTIQELAIHFSKSIRQDYHSVRNQIIARVEALAKCKEFSVEESSDNFKESTLGMHAANGPCAFKYYSFQR
jgi:hypothetical protein